MTVRIAARELDPLSAVPPLDQRRLGAEEMVSFSPEFFTMAHDFLPAADYVAARICWAVLAVAADRDLSSVGVTYRPDQANRADQVHRQNGMRPLAAEIGDQHHRRRTGRETVFRRYLNVYTYSSVSQIGGLSCRPADQIAGHLDLREINAGREIKYLMCLLTLSW